MMAVIICAQFIEDLVRNPSQVPSVSYFEEPAPRLSKNVVCKFTKRRGERVSNLRPSRGALLRRPNMVPQPQSRLSKSFLATGSYHSVENFNALTETCSTTIFGAYSRAKMFQWYSTAQIPETSARRWSCNLETPLNHLGRNGCLDVGQKKTDRKGSHCTKSTPEVLARHQRLELSQCLST